MSRARNRAEGLVRAKVGQSVEALDVFANQVDA